MHELVWNARAVFGSEVVSVLDVYSVKEVLPTVKAS